MTREWTVNNVDLRFQPHEREWIYQMQLLSSAILFPFPFQIECNFLFRLIKWFTLTHTHIDKHKHKKWNEKLRLIHTSKKKIIWISSSSLLLTQFYFLFAFSYDCIAFTVNNKINGEMNPYIPFLFIPETQIERKKKLWITVCNFIRSNSSLQLLFVFFCNFLYFN